MLEWFFNRNFNRINQLVMDELADKKKGLGWWRRIWNTSEEIHQVELRTAELITKEFDVLRGKNE